MFFGRIFPHFHHFHPGSRLHHHKFAELKDTACHNHKTNHCSALWSHYTTSSCLTNHRSHRWYSLSVGSRGHNYTPLISHHFPWCGHGSHPCNPHCILDKVRSKGLLKKDRVTFRLKHLILSQQMRFENKSASKIKKNF